MFAVEARGVVKEYGRRRAVDGIDIDVRSGEIFGLLGPNGSGKTTLIRVLMGLTKPSAGSVSLLGTPMPDKRVLSNVGYMTQANALYEDLSVRQNIAFFASMCGVNDRERIDRVIDLVDLRDRAKSRVRTLSGGMVRRTSLACSLVHSPKLVILDEPTVGVDPALRVVFWDHFRRSADSGDTYLITSHVMDEAHRCDRLGFIRDGKLIAVGSPAELIRSAGAATLEEAFLAFTRSREESA